MNVINLPPQQLPFTRKNKEWRKKHLDWADGRSFVTYSPVRKSIMNKQINYDLVNGILHMEDIKMILNPDNVLSNFIPENIQHYPIINSKIEVLQGEESHRVFDYRVVVTNPNSISKIEEEKKSQMFKLLQAVVEDTTIDDQQAQAETQKMSDYFNYTWKDLREQRANYLLNHYVKEYSMPGIFNAGILDAIACGEEMYQCDIRGGEPIIERINPKKIRIFKSGYSNKVEDADMIILEDYWSPGKIVDTYYDVLTTKDRKYIEELPNNPDAADTDEMGNIDDRNGFLNTSVVIDGLIQGSDEGMVFGSGFDASLMPYDFLGNVRVLRLYWKSRRKIKKVKSYDELTGEEIFNFYSEDYILDKTRGEEEEVYWINEAWEGTKIGKKVYLNMRPRPIQYNRLSNPSRCHFGIVGSIYNINESKPFSLIDMAKPYSYLYDIMHDRLNKLIAKNWGKIIKLDLAKIPEDWTVDKWLYFAKTNGVSVEDSFKEGNIGAATGRLAGALNNASSGVIDADWGNNIQQYINLLEYIKSEMSSVLGISPQREGQVANRETVGGVERATLQSSHITEWLFITHEDVKRRVLECFIETAKIAIRGKSKKFQYILPDYATKMVEIDGDEFAENDYGLVVDNSNSTQELNQKIDMLAQAALQNQSISFSSVMKLFTTMSLAEKQRMIEKSEQEMMQSAEQQQQANMQMEQSKMEQMKELEKQRMEAEALKNRQDNETRIVVANINSKAEMAMLKIKNDETSDAAYTTIENKKIEENRRQFNEKLKLDLQKVEEAKRANRENEALKGKQINKISKQT